MHVDTFYSMYFCQMASSVWFICGAGGLHMAASDDRRG